MQTQIKNIIIEDNNKDFMQKIEKVAFIVWNTVNKEMCKSKEPYWYMSDEDMKVISNKYEHSLSLTNSYSDYIIHLSMNKHKVIVGLEYVKDEYEMLISNIANNLSILLV